MLFKDPCIYCKGFLYICIMKHYHTMTYLELIAELRKKGDVKIQSKFMKLENLQATINTFEVAIEMASERLEDKRLLKSHKPLICNKNLMISWLENWEAFEITEI